MHRDDVIGLLFDKDQNQYGHTIWRYTGSAKGMDYTYMRVTAHTQGFFWAMDVDKRLGDGTKVHATNNGKSPSPSAAMLACLDSFERAVAMINGASVDKK